MVAATQKACTDPAIARQEAAFLAALSAFSRYRTSGDTLVLLSGAVERARMASAK
jgi:heat shock protein HslJ